jgi:ABC-type multidrug transport system fused ATPase/permease subunit
MTTLPAFASRDRVIDAVLVVACGAGQAFAAAVAAFATRDIFAAMHAGNGVPLRPLIELGAMGVFAAFCFWLSQRRAEALGQSYANALRRCLYGHISRLPKTHHERRSVGGLSLRFVGDLSAARLWFGTGLPGALTAVVVLPGAMAILFALDDRLAPAGVLPLLAALAIAAALAWRLQVRHRVLRSHRAGLAIAMIERIAVSPELDLMGRTDRELRALDARGATLRADAVARRGRSASLQAVLQSGAAIAGVVVLWRGGAIDAPPGTVAASLAVLALVALPLQNLATAWDRYCAWLAARSKALALLAEPELARNDAGRSGPVAIAVSGEIDGVPVELSVAEGGVCRLDPRVGPALARFVAGLDAPEGVTIAFASPGGTAPRTAFIGDHHVGLRGSLRRSATLLNRKRPSDKRIAEALRAYGLGHLLETAAGLDLRIAESGRTLSREETLRLDLVRADLATVGLVVIDSIRWRAAREAGRLLETFRSRCHATVVVVDDVEVGECPDR